MPAVKWKSVCSLFTTCLLNGFLWRSCMGCFLYPASSLSLIILKVSNESSHALQLVRASFVFVWKSFVLRVTSQTEWQEQERECDVSGWEVLGDVPSPCLSVMMPLTCAQRRGEERLKGWRGKSICYYWKPAHTSWLLLKMKISLIQM